MTNPGKGGDRVNSSYLLSAPGIFRTIQGEGAMIGEPMTFIRLAGCSVGCPLCDTDYRVTSRATAAEISAGVALITPPKTWVWITGGEPTDHDLGPLLTALGGFRVALATSGIRPVAHRPDWLSVSPHDPGRWAQRSGDELKIIPGLNGFGLADFASPISGAKFAHRYAFPCWGLADSVAECAAWVEGNPGWRLGVQAHKHWGLP